MKIHPFVRPGTTRDWLAALVAAVLSITVGVLVAAPASAATITSAGPLDSIQVTPDLNCAVDHVGDTEPEFYGTTACGTLVAVGGTLYGPADIPAGGSASPRTSFTPVSQTSAGAGSAGDPYTVTTVVDLAATGVRISQVDSYVVGQESYRTDTTVTNTSDGPIDAVLYRAGDCYLQDSDFGWGSYDAATGAVTCLGGDATAPGTRIEQFYPLSSGSSYYEGFYDDMWAAIGTQQPFPNQCAGCSTYEDNAAGLSWTLTALAAGASVTKSHLTTFSPLGIQPLTTTKSADQSTASAGGDDGYTITVHNANPADQTVSSITDTLPSGFSYTAGTTTGATTSDPSVSGQSLTWAGPFVVAGGGDVTLHFGVTVSSTPGTYYNNAGGTADSVAIAPTGDTAPVTVTGGNEPPTSDAGGPYAGDEGSAIAISGASSDPDGDAVTTTWSATPAAGVAAGASCTFADASAADTTVTCTDNGSWTLTLAVDDGQHAAVTSTADLSVANVDPAVSITTPSDLDQVLVGSSVSLSADISDPGTNDTHTCSIDWGDGSTSTGTVAGGTCTSTHTYDAIGTDEVTVTVTDDDEGVGSDTIMLVAYDHETKVTGGGFVMTDGHVSFGLVATSGDAGPRGQIQVRVPGRERFHGDTVTSLDVSGNTATWSGVGSWNAVGGYQFTVTVVDNRNGGGRRGTADTIELTITAPDGSTVLSTSGPLRGGNITVHR